MQINWYETSLSSDYATIGGQGGRVTMGFLESPTKISNTPPYKLYKKFPNVVSCYLHQPESHQLSLQKV